MRSKVLDAGTLRGRLHHVPDRLGRDSILPDFTQSTYSSEDRATIDASRPDIVPGRGVVPFSRPYPLTPPLLDGEYTTASVFTPLPFFSTEARWLSFSRPPKWHVFMRVSALRGANHPYLCGFHGGLRLHLPIWRTRESASGSALNRTWIHGFCPPQTQGAATESVCASN